MAGYRPSTYYTERPSEARIEELVRYYAGRCATCGARSCRLHKRARRVERSALTPALIRARFVELVRRGLDVPKVSKAMRQLDPPGRWTHEKCRRLAQGVTR